MMLVFLPIILPIFLFFLKRCFFRYRSIKLPPGPNIFQILGKISLFAKMPHVALGDLAKICGPMMSLNLGTQIVVVASSPDTAKEILKNRVFSGRFLPSVYYNVPGVTQASLVMARECNDIWKFLRGVSQNNVFSAKAVESAAGIRAKIVTDMVEFLRTNKAGKSVKLEDVVSATFINIISNVLVSKNVFDDGGEGETDGRVMRFINKLVEGGTTFGVTDVFPVLKWVDFWSKGLTTYIFREISFIWGEIVKERRMGYHDDANYDNSTKDFLDVLNEYGLSDDQIGILLTELLIGGTTSTTTTAMWLMIELMKNQECLDKLRKEIANKAVDDGGNTLNESLLSQCQYLQACIKETLRLHVPSPLGVPHRATETCKVNNGYTIPKDSIVMVNVWAIQMDPNNWENATSFKPERFLNSGIDFKGINFEYIPFGAGQRMCPGANVAFKGVQLVVASLVHYFDWNLPNGKDLGVLDTSDRFRTTLLKDKPLYMIPKPRDNYIVG